MEVQDPAVEAQQALVDPLLRDLPLVHGVHVATDSQGDLHILLLCLYPRCHHDNNHLQFESVY